MRRGGGARSGAGTLFVVLGVIGISWLALRQMNAAQRAFAADAGVVDDVARADAGDADVGSDR